MRWSIVFITAVALVASCVQHATISNDPLPKINATVSSGGEATQAARDSVNAAMPHADPTGQTILTKMTLPLLDRIRGLWSTTSSQLEEERQQKQAIADTLKARDTELVQVKSGWGYRTQVRVHRWWTVIKWALGLGFVVIVILRLISSRLTGLLGTGAWLALKGIYAFATAGISVLLDIAHFLADRLVDWISGWFSKEEEEEIK